MSATSPLGRLTPSQLRILRVLHECGWLYKSAAAQLGIPESTLRTTVHRATRRAGIPDRADLAYWMGVQDGYDALRGVKGAGTSGADGDALGRSGRPDGRAA